MLIELIYAFAALSFLGNIYFLYRIKTKDSYNDIMAITETIYEDVDYGITMSNLLGHTTMMNKQAKNIFGVKENSEFDITKYFTHNYLYEPEKEIHIGDRIYDIKQNNIMDNDRVYGKIYIIIDTTKKYKKFINIKEQQKISAIEDVYKHLSHEMKTPIFHIKSLLDMVLDNKKMKDETDIRYMGIMKGAIKQLELLVLNVLDYNNYRSNVVSTKLENKDLGIILKDYIDDKYCHIIKEKEFEISIDVEDAGHDTECYFDELKIKSVFDNLVYNSVKYSKVKKKIRIKIIHYKNHCKILFEDAGGGVTEAQLSRLFEPYYRIENDFTNEGTGLGLTICTEIIKRHSSTLKAFNNDMGGLSFTWTLSKTK